MGIMVRLEFSVSHFLSMCTVSISPGEQKIKEQWMPPILALSSIPNTGRSTAKVLPGNWTGLSPRKPELDNRPEGLRQGSSYQDEKI